jgi:hypothetical protein
MSSFLFNFMTSHLHARSPVLVSYASRSSLGRCILVCLIFRREIYRFCFRIFWSSGSKLGETMFAIWLRRPCLTFTQQQVYLFFLVP